MTLLRISEAAKYSGISVNTLRTLIDKGEIKGKRIGGQRRVSEKELDRFMEEE